MNILWITNGALPEASKLMNEKPSPFGGWFVSASSILAAKEGVKLSIAFPKKRLNDIKKLRGEQMNYYVFPPVSEKEAKLKGANKYFQKLLDEVNPDIVHIFGTEYPHTNAMINSCSNHNVVISIQGLTSIIAKHYISGLPERIQNRFTLRDFVKQDNLRQQQSKFVRRGKLELEALQKVSNIIGRTTWDKACINQINLKAKYYFCNEILRDEFYKYRWDIDRCEKYSIFLSQGSYPIKGLHFMLEAMPLILRQFPDTRLYIGGNNILKKSSLIERLKISSYGKYIRELINKYNLNDSVFFNGILDEYQICERYLQANLFVCPSSIENSPNSLGEAMLLGVPSVASYVGGIPDMLTHGEEGFLYQHDAPYMLAHYICEIFSNEDLALKFSRNARLRALKTHDRDKNTKRLIEIYRKITENI